MSIPSRAEPPLAGSARRRLPRCIYVLIACATMHAGGIARAAGLEVDPIEARIVPCTLCHGAEGRAGSDGYYPRIAGKPVGYLYNQLRAFRDGGRRYEPMRRLLASLDDTYLYRIAGYFAGQKLPYPPPQRPEADARELALGERLVRQGDGERLTACVRCHGERLTGVAPTVPGLLGLPRDYINAQLGAWREGQRSAGAHDCMARIARSLAPAEIRSISNWLAARPVPQDGVPAATPASDAVHDCGSFERGARPPGPAASSSVEDPVLARGRYLARLGNCKACHSRPGAPAWTGGRGIETPFGTVYSSNLTPSARDGLGRWTVADFRRAMREGIGRDGRPLYPVFPYPSFTRMSDEDVDAIFAYLRTLDAAPGPQPAHRLRFPYGSDWALRAWRALFFEPARFRPDAARSAEWNRGAYLARGIGHCAECHAPRNRFGAMMDPLRPRGASMPDGWHAPSLVDAAVVGRSTEALAGLLRHGQRREGWAIGPMAEVVAGGTRYLSAGDARALAGYLVSEAAPDPAAAEPVRPASTSTLAFGKTVYADRCADCHGREGEGRPPISPALVGNATVLSSASNDVVRAILQGGFAPQTSVEPMPYGMPPFAAALDDRQIASVASYIRNAWGNARGAVSAREVAALRGGH